MPENEPKTERAAGGESDLSGLLAKVADLMERNLNATEKLEARVADLEAAQETVERFLAGKDRGDFNAIHERVTKLEASSDTVVPAVAQLQRLGQSLTAAVAGNQRNTAELTRHVAYLMGKRGPRSKGDLN